MGNAGTKTTPSFPQDSQGFLNSLPSYVIDLPFLVVRCWTGLDNSHRDFKVRQIRVHDSLVWLKENDVVYHDIHIGMDVV